MAAPRSEPFWWLLFSAGGMMTAIFLPGHLIFQGIALPLGWIPSEAITYERMHALVSHPIAKLYLFTLLFLSFFHGAHRLKHVLYDLGVKAQRPPAFLCYGLAFVMTILAGLALVKI